MSKLTTKEIDAIEWAHGKLSLRDNSRSGQRKLKILRQLIRDAEQAPVVSALSLFKTNEKSGQ